MGRELPCRHKRRFSSGARARSSLRGVMGRGEHTEEGKPQRAYYCSHCGGYHLTSSGAGNER